MLNINLDDSNESSFYIPFEGEDDTHAEDHSATATTSNPAYYLSLRLREHRKVWGKCLARIQARRSTYCSQPCDIDSMQDVVRASHEPIIRSVVEEMVHAEDKALHGLPYPEIPAICLTNYTGASAFITELGARIEDEAEAAVITLNPDACSNISLCMKALVSGFIEHPVIQERVPKLKRRGNTLAAYDLGLLAAWHREVPDIRLVAVLNDFEDFDPNIVRHMFEICSVYASQLPLTVVLACSSPPTPSYIHATFPRSVLALLRLRTISFPSGPSVVREIVEKTFFDNNIDPDLMIGPGVLDFLADYTSRHIANVDIVTTILQIAHLKHFATEPLAALAVTSENLPHTGLQTPPAEVDAARTGFHLQARRLRMGLSIARRANAFVIAQGHRGLPWESNILPILSDALRGRPPPELKQLIRMVKLLEPLQLLVLMHELSASLAQSQDFTSAESEVCEYTSALDSAIETSADDPSACREIATDFGEWLAGCIGDLVSVQLEDCKLFEIWYTNRAPFPSELLNPNVRASVISALVQPHAFAEAAPQTSPLSRTPPRPKAHPRPKHEENDDEEPLWTLPDTAIVFARYLDSGRMINVYDWFEAFRAVLDAQREERAQATATGEGYRDSANGLSAKSLRKSKKGKKRPVADDGIDAESWALEMQARFVRALHELDYMGFLKHTGRKADHVVKMTFDVVD
ncbi:origin recognition complex subunit 3 N-terminus-domain-containing protein [Schizophyllum fasciatum]